MADKQKNVVLTSSLLYSDEKSREELQQMVDSYFHSAEHNMIFKVGSNWCSLDLNNMPSFTDESFIDACAANGSFTFWVAVIQDLYRRGKHGDCNLMLELTEDPEFIAITKPKDADYVELEAKFLLFKIGVALQEAFSVAGSKRGPVLQRINQLHQEIKKLLQNYPSEAAKIYTPEFHLLSAIIVLVRENNDTSSLNKAQQLVQNALIIDNTHALALVVSGQIALSLGKAPEAVELFSRALLSNPLLPAGVRVCLGKAYHLGQKIERARACFFRALQLEADNIEAIASLCALEVESSKHRPNPNVLKLLAYGLKLAPTHALLLFLAGKVAAQQLFHTQAVTADFIVSLTGDSVATLDQNTMNSKPDQTSILGVNKVFASVAASTDGSISGGIHSTQFVAAVRTEQGELFQHYNCFSIAKKYYQAAVDMAPSARTWFGLAQCHYQQQNYAEARDAALHAYFLMLDITSARSAADPLNILYLPQRYALSSVLGVENVLGWPATQVLSNSLHSTGFGPLTWFLAKTMYECSLRGLPIVNTNFNTKYAIPSIIPLFLHAVHDETLHTTSSIYLDLAAAATLRYPWIALAAVTKAMQLDGIDFSGIEDHIDIAALYTDIQKEQYPAYLAGLRSSVLGFRSWSLVTSVFLHTAEKVQKPTTVIGADGITIQMNKTALASRALVANVCGMLSLAQDIPTFQAEVKYNTVLPNTLYPVCLPFVYNNALALTLLDTPRDAYAVLEYITARVPEYVAAHFKMFSLCLTWDPESALRDMRRVLGEESMSDGTDSSPLDTLRMALTEDDRLNLLCLYVAGVMDHSSVFIQLTQGQGHASLFKEIDRMFETLPVTKTPDFFTALVKSNVALQRSFRERDKALRFTEMLALRPTSTQAPQWQSSIKQHQRAHLTALVHIVDKCRVILRTEGKNAYALSLLGAALSELLPYYKSNKRASEDTIILSLLHRIFSALVLLDNTNGEYAIALGHVLVEQGRYPEAIVAYRGCAAAAEGDEESYVEIQTYIARAYFLAGSFTESIEVLTTLSEKYPNNFDVKFNLQYTILEKCYDKFTQMRKGLEDVTAEEATATFDSFKSCLAAMKAIARVKSDEQQAVSLNIRTLALKAEELLNAAVKREEEFKKLVHVIVSDARTISKNHEVMLKVLEEQEIEQAKQKVLEEEALQLKIKEEQDEARKLAEATRANSLKAMEEDNDNNDEDNILSKKNKKKKRSDEMYVTDDENAIPEEKSSKVAKAPVREKSLKKEDDNVDDDANRLFEDEQEQPQEEEQPQSKKRRVVLDDDDE